MGNSVEPKRLACQGVLSENRALCLTGFQLRDQMSDARQGQSFNMWWVMYIFETILQTGLWQTTSEGKGGCVSPVTFTESLCQCGASFLVTPIKNSVFHVQPSRMLQFKWQPQQLGEENGPRKDKNNIYPSKRSARKFSRAVSAEEVRQCKPCPKYFFSYYLKFERWFINSLPPGNIFYCFKLSLMIAFLKSQLPRVAGAVSVAYFLGAPHHTETGHTSRKPWAKT